MIKEQMNRRSFMKQLSLAALSLTAAPDRMSAKPLKNKPNIVIILADDMGFSDIGCYGGEIDTPNIDKLAANGLRFSQFYNTARCCPTRASLLTGLYQHATGIGHMTGNKGIPSYQGYLNKKCVTIAEALKPSGYRSYMLGKWHVGGAQEHWPGQRGFDRFYGIPTGGGVFFWPPTQFRQRDVVLDDEPHLPQSGWYFTDGITDYALKFMDEAASTGKPFFMYIAHNAPHFPLQAHKKDIEKYRGRYQSGWDKLRQTRYQRIKELGLFPKDYELSDQDSPSWETIKRKKFMDHKMATYAAQVHCLDRNVGRVIKKLKSLGKLDNTLILFLSDNGGTAEGGNTGFDRVPNAELGTDQSFSSYGQGWANASNTPFRKYKMWVHEGGISTPLIAHWPNAIKQKGEITHQVGHVIDLIATCLDVAGAKYPSEFKGEKILPLEGKSLMPIFTGKTRMGHKALFWEHEGNRAVRAGKWKLVARHKGPWELYDLEADRTERSNLIEKYPERAKELEAMWNDWARRCGVVVPYGAFPKKKK